MKHASGTAEDHGAADVARFGMVREIEVGRDGGGGLRAAGIVEVGTGRAEPHAEAAV
jgi:hypothetical protein